LNAGNAAVYTAVAGTGAVGNGARAGLEVGRVVVEVPAIGVIETSAKLFAASNAIYGCAVWRFTIELSLQPLSKWPKPFGPGIS
jgi:hypothetical protein